MPALFRVPSLTRPRFRMLNATLCPSPIVPRTFSTGTATLSSISTVVEEPSSPELPFVGTAHHAHAAFDDEGGELLAVDLGEDGEEVGEAAIGDPRLLPVQDVVGAIRREPRRGPSPTAHRSPSAAR